jgi:hypothetical protein
MNEEVASAMSVNTAKCLAVSRVHGLGDRHVSTPRDCFHPAITNQTATRQHTKPGLRRKRKEKQRSMASSNIKSSDAHGARTLPTADELSQAFAVEVYDGEGKTKKLGELVQGQKSILVFIRHFCKFIGDVKM